MNNNLKVFFNPLNAITFILIALCFQFIYLYFLKTFDSPNTSGLYLLKGDAYQYINYCENFYKYFEYFEGELSAKTSFTNRMPGMCVLYFPIRLFCSQPATLNVFVIIQTILASIASYCIAIIALKVFKSNRAFYLTFALYATSTFIANNNYRLYTESLALSTIIFSLYFFVLYLEKKHWYLLLLCASFLIWCVFLRPFMAPFIGLAFLYILYKYIKKTISIKHFAVFVIPVFMAFGTWTYRNYTVTKMFIPLQSGNEWWLGSEAMTAQVHFIQTFGLGWVWWDQKSEHTWFMPDNTIKFFKTIRPNDSIFNNWYSTHIFTKDLTIDTLKRARELYWLSLDPKFSYSQQSVYAHQSAIILEKFISSQKQNNPFMYYFVYRYKLLLKFLNHRLGAAVYSFKYPLNIGITFFDALANYFIFIWGSISIILTFFYSKLKSPALASILLIPIFIISYFSFYMRIDESRFITMAVPFLLLLSVNGFLIISTSKHKKILLSGLFLFLLYWAIYSVINDIRW